MDLKELITILEKKLKVKDYTLPYTNSSSDFSTIQNINNNLSENQIEKLLKEILNKNVQTVLKNITQDETNSETCENNLYSFKDDNNENISNTLDHEYIENEKDKKHANENNVDKQTNNDVYNINNKQIKNFDLFSPFSKNKNILLYNFLNFSNENVIKNIKNFSLSNDFFLINSSYKELINFIGYYKISSFLFEGVDEFKIFINFFKKDLLTAYNAYLHNQYDVGFKEIINSSKKLSQIEYVEVLEDLEKSQQDFQNENEKIVEKNNNKIDSLIAEEAQQKYRNRKMILSGFFLLGSYMILTKTGIGFLLGTVPAFQSIALKGLPILPLQLSKVFFSSVGSEELNNIKNLGSVNHGLNIDNIYQNENHIRFRDIYDLAIKILYKKLIYFL